MATTSSMAAACAPITMAANGVLSIAGAVPTVLAANAVYFPPCVAATKLGRRALIVTGGVSTDETTSSLDSPNYSDLRNPFEATIFPQGYALAATTVLAYMLFIMLIIAPRSFLDGGVVTLGRRGFTNSHSNGATIGGRPWLQKIATLLVAVSLTIASVDTFRVAEEQYLQGYQDAHMLQQQVLGGTQLKTIQLISDTFLWLAQAQTLIRLFPRQREKIIIKWTAFALITLDVIFGALNSFQYTSLNSYKPRQFTEAVPALSYLFQLSLGLLYAAWVLYYALTKKRYAFYHPLMKNISLMATLSIGSLLVPVVFFVLDIAKSDFTAWGDYVRWVGAAAASVVVWEWVERIEALEREEKKDGVLGREVFDGDEMIDMSPSDLTWPRRRKNFKNSSDADEGGDSATSSSSNRDNLWPAMSSIAKRYRSKSGNNPGWSEPDAAQQASTTGREIGRFLQPPLWPSRPPAAVTPISRTDTASADSTIYQVRYQPLTETTSRTTDDRYRPPSRVDTVGSSHPDAVLEKSESHIDTSAIQSNPTTPMSDRLGSTPGIRWGSWLSSNLFRRKSRDPPAEVLPHTMPKVETLQRDHETFSRWDIRDRMENFAATQAERILQRIRPTPDTDSLPVTVIPAPPRRGAALGRLLETERLGSGPAPSPLTNPGPGDAGTISRTMVSTPPRQTRTHSGATQHIKPPLLSQSDRNKTSAHGSANMRPSGSSSDTTDGDLRITAYAERRPVDDLIRDQSHAGRPI
ncbi:PalH/RIM21-domain-containing protein [Xylaria sp. FL1042]|nr:PalH/RIM21-domain-containing protein [Xylaria sp. FL1042]